MNASHFLKPGVQESSALYLLTQLVPLMDALSTQMNYQSPNAADMHVQADLQMLGEPYEDGLDSVLVKGLYHLTFSWDEREWQPAGHRREAHVFVYKEHRKEHQGPRLDIGLEFAVYPSEDQTQKNSMGRAVRLDFENYAGRDQVIRQLACGLHQFLNTGNISLVEQVKLDLEEALRAMEGLQDPA